MKEKEKPHYNFTDYVQSVIDRTQSCEDKQPQLHYSPYTELDIAKYIEHFKMCYKLDICVDYALIELEKYIKDPFLVAYHAIKRVKYIECVREIDDDKG